MISIITAVHNQLPMNQVFYENLKKYTHHKFELIIIDNASNDGSAEFFESVGAKVIRNKDNYSYPYAQNQGIAEASFEYLGFLNNDIIVSKDWDKHLIDTMHSQDFEAITCCGIERLESKKATRRIRRRWSAIKNIIGYFSKSKKAIELMHRLMYPDWESFTRKRYEYFGDEVREGFVGNTVLFKKSLIEKIGVWDERLQAADFDLYMRLKERSKKVGDVKPLHYALGTFIHHYIRFTVNSGGYPPYKDAANHIDIKEKWGKEKVETYMKDQSW